jgi:adenylate cyclase
MASKLRFSIGFKLSLVISLILLGSLSLITVSVSWLVSADIQLTAENNNWTMNWWSSTAAEQMLGAYRGRALFLIRAIDTLVSRGGAADVETLSGRFFRVNPDISCVAFIGRGNSPSGIMMNERFSGGDQGSAQESRLSRSHVSEWLDSRQEELDAASEGGISLVNGYSFFQLPCIAMFFPLPAEDGFSFAGAGVLLFLSASLEESVMNAGSRFASNSSFIINGKGDVLIHSNPEYVRTAVNVASSALGVQALEGSAANLQTKYSSADGEQFFGAYQRISGLDAVVITVIPASQVFGGIAKDLRRIVLISAATLLAAVIAMACYSRTISVPLKVLINGVRAIEQGNYQPDIRIKTGDEIEVLADSFIAMGKGLVNFERFTNKRVVALAREHKLGIAGEKRRVTICFAMIRDFTDLSHGMSPSDLVDFVNRFLESVVPCVTKTGGLVDKFLTQGGLVVMCLWGAAETSGVAASDAFNCVRSALEMRAALRRLNMERLASGNPGALIKMGCGINSGDVIVGQMGSDERMEFTVIGDAVNLAARIEGPNDAFDTDILISEDTFDLAGKYLLTEEMPSLKVKGKEKPLRVFSVVNIKNYYGPESMDDVRKLWTM